MENLTVEKINTAFLPQEWKQILADKFGITTWKAESIVYQRVKITPKNIKVFKAALEMAEEAKAALDELNKRLAALSK